MDVIGGGVLVAAAAALWIAYLLPTWLRRRQYLATERNAVRLQQTLRILAETAETPEAVRVEATAREVAASVQAQITEPITVIAPATTTASAADAAHARRALRRRRALCSLFLLVSLLTVVAGMVASAFGVSLLVA